MLKVGFLFPGYGSQYIGMGKNLYDNFRIVQDFFEDASSCLDINFVKLCFASSDSEISKLHNAYFSIFLISYSTASLIKSELDIDISLVSGFQFGEYCAMSYAGPPSLSLFISISHFLLPFSFSISSHLSLSYPLTASSHYFLLFLPSLSLSLIFFFFLSSFSLFLSVPPTTVELCSLQHFLQTRRHTSTSLQFTFRQLISIPSHTCRPSNALLLATVLSAKRAC
jgi:hypothetical protein